MPPPAAGILGEPEFVRARVAANAAQVDLGRWLMDEMGLSRLDAERTLATNYGCPFLRLDEQREVPAVLRAVLHESFLRRACAVPVEIRGTDLDLVMEDPTDLVVIDHLRSFVPGGKAVVHVGMRDEILACVDRSYNGHSQLDSIMLELELDHEGSSADADAASEVGEADGAVVKLANQLILDGLRRGASDIHVEPNGPRRPARGRLRIDGDCVEYEDVPSRFRGALVARLKIMARLDIAERRKPQDGKIRFKLGEREIELRVATYPTASGDEDVVMRLLPDGKPLPLAKLHFSARNLAAMQELIRLPYGLVLCVGPTGSGKTTTLHSALSEINHVDLKICTVEDPVEITQPGLRQVQVFPRIGLTFEVMLRSLLRADPDVIMIGEMRDTETAKIAIEASLTGHLVLSTLHTNSAPETITRLIDMGVDSFTFADSLMGVMAQRLALSLCPECRERCPRDGEDQNRLEQVLTEMGASAAPSEPPWRGRGCEHCAGTGYRGRTALHELLVVDDDMRHAIGRHAPIAELRKMAAASGMRTLLEDGIDKVRAGLTDLRQVLAVCSR